MNILLSENTGEEWLRDAWGFLGMYPGPPGRDNFYLHFKSFCMVEHLGTHIDSPNHVLRSAQQGLTMDTIDKVS